MTKDKTKRKNVFYASFILHLIKFDGVQNKENTYDRQDLFQTLLLFLQLRWARHQWARQQFYCYAGVYGCATSAVGICTDQKVLPYLTIPFQSTKYSSLCAT